MTDVIVVRENGSLDVGLLCEDPSLTKQSEAKACDINEIMRRYEKTGLIAHQTTFEGFYGDISSLPDFHGAFEVVRRAEEQFLSLPAELRSKFDNDPSAYLAFVMDPVNRPEMVKLGMIEEKRDDKPIAPGVEGVG